MLRLWLQMLPSFLCSAPVVCWLALSDLSKSPLLHILQLVPPLEPKRRGRVIHTFESIYTVWICISLWAFDDMLHNTEAEVLTWLFLLVRSGSSSADSWSGLWGRCPLAAESQHYRRRERGDKPRQIQVRQMSLCAIPTQIIQSHSQHKGWFKYYSETQWQEIRAGIFHWQLDYMKM